MRDQRPQLAAWCHVVAASPGHHAVALLARGHNARMPSVELRPAVAGDHPPIGLAVGRCCSGDLGQEREVDAGRLGSLFAFFTTTTDHLDIFSTFCLLWSTYLVSCLCKHGCVVSKGSARLLLGQTDFNGRVF